VIPALYFAPRDNGSSIEISGFFSVGSNRSSRFQTEILVADFPSFWETWLADPEECARKLFDWNGPQTNNNPVAAFDLDDLLEGLE
jgi:hypothetical protein